MIDTTYTGALTLAAGSFLLAAVLIVWRRELKATISLLAWQGAALAAIPIANGIHQGTWGPIVVGIVVLALRGAILPLFLARAARGEGRGAREVTPLVNTTAALLATAALTMVAYAATRPLIEHSPTPGTRAAPATFAALLIAVFVLVSRRRAISQAIGFLMLDNAIAATAFLITAGVPLIVELGASLDILFAMVVLGVLTDRMRQSFGDTDLNQLRELRD